VEDLRTGLWPLRIWWRWAANVEVVKEVKVEEARARAAKCRVSSGTGESGVGGRGSGVGSAGHHRIWKALEHQPRRRRCALKGGSVGPVRPIFRAHPRPPLLRAYPRSLVKCHARTLGLDGDGDGDGDDDGAAEWRGGGGRGGRKRYGTDVRRCESSGAKFNGGRVTSHLISCARRCDVRPGLSRLSPGYGLHGSVLGG
jgi:hypothetical protein